MPALVESYERSLRLRETDGAATEEKPHDDVGAQPRRANWGSTL